MDWKDVTSSFQIISARNVLAMQDMERYQDVRDRVKWLTADEQPLALLFISHRWETLEHPDPSGRHFKAIQEFLRRLCICIEAMLIPKKERLQFVPSLTLEGTLQAEEVARRILGFGPFSDSPACIKEKDARKVVSEKFKFYQNNKPAFRDWLSGKIGLWLDYTCMPQKPLSPEDEPEFRRTLGALDSLTMSSTLVALRDADDDYPLRCWCASEFFLASAHSFSRAIFIDVGRMEKAREVAIAHVPMPDSRSRGGTGAPNVMREVYDQDLAAFQETCEQWSSFEGRLIQITPPDPWARYRDLQGSSFFAAEYDPNPLRRVLEAVRNTETVLIKKWLMSNRSHIFDFGKEMAQFFQGVGLQCAVRSDLIYLGFLLACHGWIDAFRPLFRECLNRYLKTMTAQSNLKDWDSTPSLLVNLKPLTEQVRALFSKVSPSSAETWNSRLSTGPGPDPHEKVIIIRVNKALKQSPPEYTFIKFNDFRLSQQSIERLIESK